MKNFCIFLITAALSVLASCKGGSTAAFSDLDTIPLRYAKLLTLLQGDGYVVAEVKNPWGDGLLARYTIDKPLTHSVFYTSSHVSLVDELGGYDVIKGVCDLDYMYLDKVHKDVAEGKIKDCGLSMTPDLEKIMELNPDAILLSPFENSGTYGKLGKLGIPIIECADYMENTALGRAEWVKFYGLLIGKAAEADSLFAEVERDYNKVKDISHLSPLTSHVSPKRNTEAPGTWRAMRAPSLVSSAMLAATMSSRMWSHRVLWLTRRRWFSTGRRTLTSGCLSTIRLLTSPLSNWPRNGMPTHV